MCSGERVTCPDKLTDFVLSLSQVVNSTVDMITQPKTYALFLLNFIGQDRWTCLSFCLYNVLLDLSLYFLSLTEWMVVIETTFKKGEPFSMLYFLWIPFPFPSPPPFLMCGTVVPGVRFYLAEYLYIKYTAFLHLQFWPLLSPVRSLCLLLHLLQVFAIMFVLSNCINANWDVNWLSFYAYFCVTMVNQGYPVDTIQSVIYNREIFTFKAWVASTINV